MARRRWRDYQTPGGARPVREFLRSLSDEDYAGVRAAMGDVAEHGLQAARDPRGEVLLALEAFKKKMQKTPPATIALAERRLRTWRARARE